MFRVLRFSTEAKDQLAKLASAPSKEGTLKQVNKVLGHLQINPAHPGLNTHEFTSLSTKDRKVLEAYAQNNTPNAYRILWYYGPDEQEPTTVKNIPAITVFAIIPHSS